MLLACEIAGYRVSSHGEKAYETIRPHGKAARYQARERLELETHLRTDRRLFRSPDRRRCPRPDEADQTAGRQCRRAVWVVEVGNRDAQRGADARHADAADRSLDLSFLRTGDGQRPGLEGADRGGIWRRHHVGDRFRHGDGAPAQSERRPGQDHHVGQVPALQILRRQRQRAGIRFQGGVGVRGEWRVAKSEERRASSPIRHSLFAVHLTNMSRISLIGAMSRMKLNDPLSFISRAPRRKPASATRDIAPPTLMRLTPAAASWSTVSVRSAKPITRLNGLPIADSTVRMVARSRTPGAYSTSAPAASNACSRRIVSSRS